MLKTNGKRDRSVVRWHETLTQTQIAERLGVTRQRVQQIEKRLGLEPRRSPGNKKTYPFKCDHCKKRSESRLADRIFCSRECFFASRKIVLTPDQEEKRLEARRKRNRLRSRNYYHNVFKNRPDWKTVVRNRNKKYGKRNHISR